MTITLILFVGQLMAAQAGPVPKVERTVAADTQRDADLERLIRRDYVRELDQEDAVSYHYNRVDLNGDGVDEVLLRVSGRSACGTGGCPLLVLRRAGGSYKRLSRVTLTWRPVVVSEHRTRGWKDLVLWQRGYGEGEPSHYAVLAFDGQGYPGNPSVLPARPLKEPVSGVAYLSGNEDTGIPIRIRR